MSFRLFPFIFLYFIALAVNGQQPHVNILASDTLYGRGYVKSGMAKAALYIANQYTEYGLQVLPGSQSYYQSFSHPVNTFPGIVSLSTGKNSDLIPGQDFLVHPSSPSLRGSFNLIYQIGNRLGKDDLLVIEDTFATDKDYLQMVSELENYTRVQDAPGAGAIMLTDRKLTWHVADRQANKPLFIVRKDSWDKRAKKIDVEIEALFQPAFDASNVAAVIPGRESDSLVIISAHYDHLGLMGDKTIFPGANDNASGTAMLLELANYFAEHKLAYTIVFIAFASEEAGLIGSRYFVDNPPFSLDLIKLMINLDLNGTGEEGITVVNGKVLPEVFSKLSLLNDEGGYLPAVKARGEACNSDHCPFYNKGVPAVFIYTMGGIQAYHDIYDKAETLPLTEFQDLKKLLIQYILSLNP